MTVDVQLSPAVKVASSESEETEEHSEHFKSYLKFSKTKGQ